MTVQLSKCELKIVDIFISKCDYLSLFMMYEEACKQQHLIDYLLTTYNYDVASYYNTYMAMSDSPEDWPIYDEFCTDEDQSYIVPKREVKISNVCTIKPIVPIIEDKFTIEDRDELCAGELDQATFDHVLRQTLLFSRGEEYTIINDVEGGCHCGRYKNLPPPGTTVTVRESELESQFIADSTLCLSTIVELPLRDVETESNITHQSTNIKDMSTNTMDTEQNDFSYGVNYDNGVMVKEPYNLGTAYVQPNDLKPRLTEQLHSYTEESVKYQTDVEVTPVNTRRYVVLDQLKISLVATRQSVSTKYYEPILGHLFVSAETETLVKLKSFLYRLISRYKLATN